MKEYKDKKVIYLEYEENIKRLITTLIKTENIMVHAIESRVKEADSLKNKIIDKDKYNALDEITDIVGLRLITYFEDDVDKVANILKKEFILDEKNSIDKRVSENPEAFGYSSLHYILKLKEPRSSLLEYHNYRNINFEIQIRSILQHAWAEIEHDLGYKSNEEIPIPIRRSFSRVSSLLETADIEFIRIKNSLKEYRVGAKNDIVQQNFDIPIDKITYLEYIVGSEVIAEINQEFAEMYSNLKIDENFISFEPHILDFFKINTVFELDRLLCENKDLIIWFVRKWLPDDTTDMFLDIAVFYLYYILILKEYNQNKFKEYLKISGIDIQQHNIAIEKMEALVKERNNLN